MLLIPRAEETPSEPTGAETKDRLKIVTFPNTCGPSSEASNATSDQQFLGQDIFWNLPSDGEHGVDDEL